MPYWVKRILLKSGELVTERELQDDEIFLMAPLQPSVTLSESPVEIVNFSHG
jgi:hypothetical protein